MNKTPEAATPKKSGGAEKSTASTTDDTLRHLAFDNTAQANIISTASNGKIVMTNRAACKLLGYSKKELLTKSRADIFDIKESSFKEMLTKRTAEGQSIALVTCIKKSGRQVHCEITSAVFMDEDGIEKAITTIADRSQSILVQKNIDTEKEKIVSDNIDLAKSEQKKIDSKKEKVVANNIILAQTKSDARLEENNEWIKYIARASYDVMWDWDVATGQIYVGDSVEEVFGYKVQNNTVNFADFIGCLLPEEKDIVEKKLLKTLASGSRGWNDSYMFKRHDGSVAAVTSRASIVRDDNGKVIRLIGAIQDISRLQQLEKKLEDQVTLQEEQGEKFLLAAKLSFDVIWDWNILTNEVFLGDGFEELFGYVIKDNKGDMIADWVNYLHPDDKETVVKELQNSIKSLATHWEHAYRVRRADGSIAKVFVRASIIRHADGKAYRMIGAMQDLSRQKELEEKLEQEIKLKEKQIAEATEDAKGTERSDIGKELHDNVNQLLAASRMYLDMAKRGGGDTKMYLSRSSEYTLTAIEEIRKLTKGLTTDVIKDLGLGEAIGNVVRDTMEVNPVKISFLPEDFTEDSVNDKFKMNVFRIVQEQLNNILKHAAATEVGITLSQNEKSILLTISDNGVGFDTNQKQKGIGLDNIKSRAASYSGVADFISQPGKGCVLTVTFPVKDVLLNNKN